LRKQVLIAACLAALALIGGVFYSARTVLTHSFATIEADEARQSIERVNKALQADLHQLDVTAADYAISDDAYEFLLGRNPGFVEHHFTKPSLDAIHVDLVWIVDTAGSAVVQLATNDSAPDGLTQPTPAVLARLQRYASLLVAPDGPMIQPARLLRLPDGVLAFAAGRVIRRNRTGPSVGTLVFGRHFDAELIARLEDTSQSPVRITLLDEHGKPTVSVPQAVSQWLASGDGPDVLVQTGDPTTLDSYALLRDVDGRPLVVLSTRVSRTGLQLGKKTITWVVAALLIGFALVVMLLLTLLNRSWRARVIAQRQWLDHQRKLSRLARRDVLTGLPNRLHLQRLLPRLLTRASRDGSRLALLYMDLDHFKNVNDSLGHGSGDKLLTAIAQRLRSSVAAHDIVVRMGGDEFVVIATLLPDAEVVNSIADRIRAALAVPLDVDGVTLSISPSIGISVYPEDGSDPEQLLKHADIALYNAKDRGRGNHQFYTPEMNARLRERLGLERALRQALDKNELFLEYQPCFDLQTLRPVSLEALIRWRTADGGLVPPSRFIPIAEQSGLIVEVGDWVLRHVCLQLSEWQREHVPLLPVSVNISVRQLEQAPLANVVSTLAKELGIDANLLHFEITESAAMQNSQAQLGSLQALRNLGSRILIDDFGTGYSSLSYLKHLPIDTLKIDRAFVRDMAVDANDAAIVRAIVAVAKSLGLQLVAEGIESAEQLECLRKLDCECGQGFYFSPPVSADGCRTLLRQLRGPRSPGEPPKLRLLNPTT
jgi:diguanylate cyclase (GGDEF)-like protein